MNINTIKLIFENLNHDDKIQINYYGALPLEFKFSQIKYSFSYGSLIIEDLVYNEVITISINTIKAIKIIKSNDGFNAMAGAVVNG